MLTSVQVTQVVLTTAGFSQIPHALVTELSSVLVVLKRFLLVKHSNIKVAIV